jgi:hypothetical protein
MRIIDNQDVSVGYTSPMGYNFVVSAQSVNKNNRFAVFIKSEN